jgi:hypothetical protein
VKCSPSFTGRVSFSVSVLLQALHQFLSTFWVWFHWKKDILKRSWCDLFCDQVFLLRFSGVCLVSTFHFWFLYFLLKIYFFSSRFLFFFWFLTSFVVYCIWVSSRCNVFRLWNRSGYRCSPFIRRMQCTERRVWMYVSLFLQYLRNWLHLIHKLFFSLFPQYALRPVLIVILSLKRITTMLVKSICPCLEEQQL